MILRSTIRAAMREPTVHFVLLAGALFAVNMAVHGRKTYRIEIDPADVAARIARIEATAGIRLGPEQRQEIEDNYIDERVLGREARAMGLDNDEQVENLLAQKMLDILSADVIQPTDSDLTAYYTAHLKRYTPPDQVTVEEIVVPGAGPLPAAVGAQLRDGVMPSPLGLADVDRHVLTQMTRVDLERIFGTETADDVFDAAVGAWVGPRQSVRGQHWLQVRERESGTASPLDSLRNQVRRDWLAEEERTRLQQRVRELRGRYNIVILDRGAMP